jgi:hypothetical protein
MTKIEVTEELRQAVIEAVAGALGGCAYDCTRVWSAWSYGTMSQDDFSLVAGDDSRLAEIDADGRFCFTVCLITHLRLNLKTTMRQFADAQPQSISTLSLMSGKSCDL